MRVSITSGFNGADPMLYGMQATVDPSDPSTELEIATALRPLLRLLALELHEVPRSVGCVLFSVGIGSVENLCDLAPRALVR